MVVDWSLTSLQRGMATFGRKTIHSQNNHLLLPTRDSPNPRSGWDIGSDIGRIDAGYQSMQLMCEPILSH